MSARSGAQAPARFKIENNGLNLILGNKMSDNKLVKTLTDATAITGLAAGIGFLARKVIKEPMTSDPSTNLMNNVKFTVVIAASLATKDYLEKQKILPS